MATGVLEDFYKENGHVSEWLFLQRKEKMDPVVAGKAPPPPPTTWEAPSSGTPFESRGIIEVLRIIKEDIEKDSAKAEAEEADANKEFRKFRRLSNKQKKELNQESTDLAMMQAEKDTGIEALKANRRSLKKMLDATMEKMT